jgi:8-oxo-dGTP diphosphatase
VGDRWSRLGAYALCRDDERRILLARFVAPGHPDSGRWTMPGGMVEWGEHPDDAVLRELEEETGLVGARRGVVAIWSQVLTAEVAVSGNPGHLIGMIYDVEIVGGELRDEVGGTTDKAAWFTLAEARAMEHGSVDIVDFCLRLCE